MCSKCQTGDCTEYYFPLHITFIQNTLKTLIKKQLLLPKNQLSSKFSQNISSKAFLHTGRGRWCVSTSKADSSSIVDLAMLESSYRFQACHDECSIIQYIRLSVKIWWQRDCLSTVIQYRQLNI